MPWMGPKCLAFNILPGLVPFVRPEKEALDVATEGQRPVTVLHRAVVDSETEDVSGIVHRNALCFFNAMNKREYPFSAIQGDSAINERSDPVVEISRH